LRRRMEQARLRVDGRGRELTFGRGETDV